MANGAGIHLLSTCVGCLAALLLKNPEGAARCGAEGVFEPVVDTMSKARTHAGVQRQCAMFLRNAVVRNPENVPLVLLNTDAEALLRLSKKNHPRTPRRRTPAGRPR